MTEFLARFDEPNFSFLPSSSILDNYLHEQYTSPSLGLSVLFTSP